MKPLRLDTLSGYVIDDDIELAELLGEGGMGLVYRARQRSLNRDLCIKFLRSNLVADVEWLKRFKREAAALSRVRNPNIVSIYFVGVLLDVYPFMAMEYVEGPSLRKVIRDENSLDWQRTCRLFLQICQALSDVHSKGFIHRDLKPDNIILSPASSGEQPKILDFGICGFSEQHLGFSRLTHTSDMIGSVYYMAPECFRQAQTRPAVDVYAMGCMLFECLTGAPPFTADSAVGLAHHHASASIPRLPEHVGDAATRAALEAVIDRACAKDPDERFNDCAELALCFAALMDGRFDDVTAVRLAPVVKKKTLSMSAVAAFLVLCIVAVSGWCLPGLVANRAEDFALRDFCARNNSDGLWEAAKRKYAEGDYKTAARYWTGFVRHDGFERPSVARLCASVNAADCERRLHEYESAVEHLIDAVAEFNALQFPQAKAQSQIAQADQLFRLIINQLDSPTDISPPGERFTSSRLIDHSDGSRKRVLSALMTSALSSQKMSASTTQDTVLRLAEIEFVRAQPTRATSVGAVKKIGFMMGLDWCGPMAERCAATLPGVLRAEDQQQFLSDLAQSIGEEVDIEGPRGLESAVVFRFTRLVQSDHGLDTPAAQQRFLIWLEAANKLGYSDNLYPSVWLICERNKQHWEKLYLQNIMRLKKLLMTRARIEVCAGGNREDVYDNFIAASNDINAAFPAMANGNAGMANDMKFTPENHLAYDFFMFEVEQIKKQVDEGKLEDAGKLIDHLTRSKLFERLSDRKHGKEVLGSILALEGSIEAVVAAGEAANRTHQQNVGLMRSWFKLAMAYSKDFAGTLQVLRCIDTASSFRYSDSLPADNEMERLQNQICADPALGTIQRIQIMGCFSANSGIRQAFKPEPNNGQPFARRNYQKIAELIVADLQRGQKIPLEALVDFEAHCLNTNLLPESCRISEAIAPRIKSCKTIDVRFRHYLYTFRNQVSTGKGEADKTKTQIELAIQTLKEMLALLKPASGGDYKSFNELTKLLAADSNASALSLVKRMVASDAQDRIRRRQAALTAKGRDANPSIESQRNMIRMAISMCELAERAAQRNDVKLAMEASLQAWSCIYH